MAQPSAGSVCETPTRSPELSVRPRRCAITESGDLSIGVLIENPQTGPVGIATPSAPPAEPVHWAPEPFDDLLAGENAEPNYNPIYHQVAASSQCSPSLRGLVTLEPGEQRAESAVVPLEAARKAGAGRSKLVSLGWLEVHPGGRETPAHSCWLVELVVEKNRCQLVSRCETTVGTCNASRSLGVLVAGRDVDE